MEEQIVESKKSQYIHKCALIELNYTIRELKERKQISDLEILRYIYKTIQSMLNQ